MNATRIADGKVVSIKRLRREPREVEIARFLSTEKEGLDYTANHCVPVLDHFSDDSEPQFSFLVMPLFRWFDDPPFYTVDEVLDFVRQTLEVTSSLYMRQIELK